MSTTGGTGTAGTTTATTTANASTPSEEAKVVIPDTTGMTLTTDVYGMFVGAFFVVLSLMVLFATGSILSVFVLWATIALVLTVMVYYGFLTIDQLLGTVAKEEKKVEKEVEKPFLPSIGRPVLGSEVFHVSDQMFTYDEAAAVCAAYGTELATLEQVMDAFSNGAEWCSYGWSAGGMALYPTQRETWDRLQGEVDYGKRTRCGRPGVNGGYFDPTLKFGVNCFGIKPPGEFTPPAPVPGVDTKQFSEMVNRFKEIMKGFTLNPYSRMEWSEFDDGKAKEKFTVGGGGVFDMFKQEFFTPYGVREHLENENSSNYVEPVGQYGLGQGASSLRGPYGLLGDKGDKGDAGPAGPTGPQGSQGLQGPEGRQGNAGGPGGQGPTGPQGVKGDQGDAGPAGPVGTGTAGGVGPTGFTGPQGPTGRPGTDGAPGPTGLQGLQGPEGRQGNPGQNATIPDNLNVSSLRIGSMAIDDTGGNLQIRNVNNPNPNRVINIWAAGDHTSMMTTRRDGSQHWFGY